MVVIGVFVLAVERWMISVCFFFLQNLGLVCVYLFLHLLKIAGSLTSAMFYIGVEGEGGLDIMSKLSKKVKLIQQL